MNWIDDRIHSQPYVTDLSRRIRPHPISLPVIFFDGACLEGMMGYGAWIKISQAERFLICCNGGEGSNNKAKLMALWIGRMAAYNFSLDAVHIYGDSKIIIDGISGQSSFSSLGCQEWFARTKYLWIKMGEPPLTHIYREKNNKADGLSKKRLRLTFGNLQVSHYKDGHPTRIFDVPIP